MARTQADRKAETRARLFDAAADLFARRGFHAVSTDTVADAAGRTSGAIYAHFGSKEGLLLALLDRWENETAAASRVAIRAEAGVRGRLGALWRTFVAGPAANEPDGLLLEHELWLYAARNPEIADALAQRYAGARRAIGQSFVNWADQDDEPPPEAPDRDAVLVMGLLLGLEMQRRLDPTSVPDDLAVEGLVALLQAASEPATS